MKRESKMKSKQTDRAKMNRAQNPTADLAKHLEDVCSEFSEHTNWLFLELDELSNAQFRVFKIINIMESLAKKIKKDQKRNSRKSATGAMPPELQTKLLETLRQFHKWSSSYEKTNDVAAHFGGALDEFMQEIGDQVGALKSIERELEGAARPRVK